MNEQIVIPVKSKRGENDINNGWRRNNACHVSENNGNEKELLNDQNKKKQTGIESVGGKKNDVTYAIEDVGSVVATKARGEKETEDDGILQQWDNWVQNANDLIQTNEFQHFTASTQTIVTTASGKIFHIATLPFTLPINITVSTTMFVYQHVSNALGDLLISDALDGNEAQKDSNEFSTVTTKEQSMKKNHDQLNGLINAALPIVFQAVDHVQQHVGSAFSSVIHGIFGGDSDGDSRCNAGQSSEVKEKVLSNSSVAKKAEQLYEVCCISNEEKDGYDDNNTVKDAGAKKMIATSSSVTTDTTDSENLPIDIQQQNQCAFYYIRVSDLGLPSSMLSEHQEDKLSNQICLALSHDSQQRGRCMHNSAFVRTIDALVQDGLFLATEASVVGTTLSPSRLLLPVHWKPEGSTQKWLRQRQQRNKSNNYSESWIALLGKEVLCWSGSLQYNHSSSINKKHHYDNNIPIFKAQGMIDNVSPKDLVSLLLDSNRVCEYNQWCLGRTDEIVFDEQQDQGNGSRIVITKIVRSETKVPLTSKTVTLRNLLHAQTLVKEKESSLGNSYILVSRSVTKNVNDDNNNKANEIVWGINLVQPVRNHPNKAMLTTLSQVKSSLVPGFMAHRIGMMGIEDFFRNLRKVASV